MMVFDPIETGEKGSTLRSQHTQILMDNILQSILNYLQSLFSSDYKTKILIKVISYIYRHKWNKHFLFLSPK